MKKATVGLALLLALSMMLLAACGGQTIDGSGAGTTTHVGGKNATQREQRVNDG